MRKFKCSHVLTTTENKQLKLRQYMATTETKLWRTDSTDSVYKL